MQRAIDPDGIEHRIFDLQALTDDEITQKLKENKNQFHWALRHGEHAIAAVVMANQNTLKLEQIKRSIERLEASL